MPESGSDQLTGLEVRGVRLVRAGRVVLEDVSFCAPKGEVTVLAGASGAGKSTLLRCLNRLLVPDAGAVLLDGADVASLDPCALRRRVGLLAQQPVMLPGSVGENLAHGLRDPPPRRIAEALRDAGLDDAFLDRRAQELSGGERARVGLARALTREPEMLLLDEPTAALDEAVARHVATTLRTLADAGLGVLVATHDLAFAAAIADRSVTLHDGVAATGGAPPARSSA
jgi:ABC-type multidrug transport system ATPase subunit